MYMNIHVYTHREQQPLHARAVRLDTLDVVALIEALSDLSEWLQKGESTEGLVELFGEEWQTRVQEMVNKDADELAGAKQGMQGFRDGMEDGDPKIAPVEYLIAFADFCIAKSSA